MTNRKKFLQWQQLSQEASSHNFYMGLALEEAKKAYLADEVPVGAVIVKNSRIIGRGYNKREHLQSPIAHAEILAINEAAETLQSWRLLNTDIYVTMEPCAMCAGALLLARVKRVFFAIEDPKGGACGSVVDLSAQPAINHTLAVYGGLRAEESREMIRSFFRAKRKLQKKLKRQKKQTVR